MKGSDFNADHKIEALMLPRKATIMVRMDTAKSFEFMLKVNNLIIVSYKTRVTVIFNKEGSKSVHRLPHAR